MSTIQVHEVFKHMVRALGDDRWVPIEKRSDTANTADWVYMCLVGVCHPKPAWDQLKAESEARSARERALVELVAYTSQAIMEAHALPDPEGDATEEEAREWDVGADDRASAFVASLMPEIIYRVMRTLADGQGSGHDEVGAAADIAGAEPALPLTPDGPVPAWFWGSDRFMDAMQLLRDGETVLATKLVRSSTGVGLRDAMNWVESPMVQAYVKGQDP